HTFPFSFGLTSLVAYVFGITHLSPFQFASQMAPHSAALLVSYSGVMLGYAWQRAEHSKSELPRWSPGLAAIMFPVLFFVFSSVMQGDSVLVKGSRLFMTLAASALLGLAIHGLKKSRVSYKGLTLISIPLIFVLAFVGMVIQMRRINERDLSQSLHSGEVIAKTESLLRSLADAETGARRYVFLGRPDFDES